jgi:tRNA threonylcarbamoyladenosine biosynthesis protein TsaE
MAKYQYIANQVADSERLAIWIANVAGADTLLALDGDLGAGKTTFSQMIAKALGVDEVVNSPTFTIIKEYEAKAGPFFHMDVYRLDAAQADQLGLDEYFFGGGVTSLEWASLIKDLLPANYLQIHILVDDQITARRHFILEPHGSPYQSWCEQWLADGALVRLEE